MRLDEMPGYGLPTLAMWPKLWYETNRWMMYDYKLMPDGKLKWFRSYAARQGHARAICYDTLEEASAAASQVNKQLYEDIESLTLSDLAKQSLRLKVEKEITCKSRLLNEEQLMLNEAIRRHLDDEQPVLTELVVPEGSESLRQPLFDYLNETPYVNYVLLTSANIILHKKGASDWSDMYRANEKNAKFAYRDRIARGYGFSGWDNWGSAKAEIRKLLLPRANELLQEAGIKRMLDAALAKGQRVLVVGRFVFWFEGSSGVGWRVLEASESERLKKGNTLWKEGTIVSKNHGRIVVLPYIKESGEHVQGHTKNGPHDGKAKPRHPGEYVELPFEVLEDDLMIGLFGELRYE